MIIESGSGASKFSWRKGGVQRGTENLGVRVTVTQYHQSTLLKQQSKGKL